MQTINSIRQQLKSVSREREQLKEIAYSLRCEMFELTRREKQHIVDQIANCTDPSELKKLCSSLSVDYKQMLRNNWLTIDIWERLQDHIAQSQKLAELIETLTSNKALILQSLAKSGDLNVSYIKGVKNHD